MQDLVIVATTQKFSLTSKGMKIMKSFTTLSGTPGGGSERFLGGGPLRYDLLSKRHSPIFPYVSSPQMMIMHLKIMKNTSKAEAGTKWSSGLGKTDDTFKL